MQSIEATEPLSCSARLLRPFVHLLANGEPVSPAMFEKLGVRDGDDRIPIGTVHLLASAAVACTQDVNIGLKAGALMSHGDAGVVDYVLSSASTVADAIEVVIRYMRLVNEALDPRLEHDAERVALRLQSRVAIPPPAEDFLVSAMFCSHAWLHRIPEIEVWFLHAAPADLHEYRRTFGSVVFRFSAPYSGFAFASEYMAQQLERADPKLHFYVRRLADIMLAELPSVAVSFSDSVRLLVARDLANPEVNAAWVAKRLHMSVRTLARRLESEGASFYGLLDDVRRSRALRLVQDRKQPLCEVAFVLGFAHAASFHRAFRRWTGQTPAEFRSALQTASGAPG